MAALAALPAELLLAVLRAAAVADPLCLLPLAAACRRLNAALAGHSARGVWVAAARALDPALPAAPPAAAGRLLVAAAAAARPDPRVLWLLLRGRAGGRSAKALALALALHRGRCDLARLLVAAGAPLGAPALGCRTLLHAAAAALDEAAVAFLLALGLPGPADPRPLRRSARGKLRRDRHHLWINEPDARGRSPLDLAAARLAHDPAAHAIVAAMLRCGCESASGPAGRLFAAIGIGDMDCVARVCGSVDINQAKNWIGDRPVHAAVRLGSIAIVQALVAAGADVDAASANGWTDWADPDRDRCRHQPPRDTPGSPAPDRRGLALVLAVERRNRPMVDLLLASGAVPASYPPGAQARLLDMSMDGDFHHRSDFRIDQFRLLLDLGCRPDPHGPLLFNAAFAVQHHARSARQYDDGLALLARLRDLGAATAPPAGAVPRPFQRALHRCALRLSRPMLQFLLSLGVDEAVMRPP